MGSDGGLEVGSLNRQSDSTFPFVVLCIFLGIFKAFVLFCW